MPFPAPFEPADASIADDGEPVPADVGTQRRQRQRTPGPWHPTRLNPLEPTAIALSSNEGTG